MNTKALFSAVILGSVASLFVACGDGDSTKVVICRATQVTCLNDHSGEVCSSDGTSQLPFSCNSGEVCGEGEDGELGCQGGCEAGATECGSEAISRVCSADGRTWLQIPCEPGTGCDSDEDNETYGTCVRRGDDDPSVSVCDDDEVTCADATTIKACELDRSGWRYTACAANEVCEENDDGASCVVDEAKGCVPNAGRCMDLTHIRYCNQDGDQYEEVEACPEGTTCADGGCQGPVCTVGAVRCADVMLGNGNLLTAIENNLIDPQTVYTCNAEGTAWEISLCENNSVCIYDNISAAAVSAFIEDAKAAYRNGGVAALPSFDIPTSSHGSCVVPDCASVFAIREIFGSVANEESLGSFACGDPTDEDANFLDSFSLCEGLVPYVKPHWANYACPENTQCVYTSNIPGGGSEEGTFIVPSCEQQCHPGTIACYSEGNGTPGVPTPPQAGVFAYGEATIECGEDGTWDYATVSNCTDPDEEREWWCGPNLMGTADNYNIGTCMEPVCTYWFETYGTFAIPDNAGACATDGKFYPCLPDGTLGEAQNCASCSATRQEDSFYAGYDPGFCEVCVDGEQRCAGPYVGPGDIGTPFYETCVDGQFEIDTCSEGALCQEYTEIGDEDEYGLRKVQCGGECQPYTAQCVDAEGFPSLDGQFLQKCNEDGEYEEAEACSFGACHQDEQDSFLTGAARCEGECIEGTKICVAGMEAVCDDGRYQEGEDELTECEDDQLCFSVVGCAECEPRSMACDSATEIKICNEDGEYSDPVTCPGDSPTCVTAGTSSAYCLPPTTGAGGAGGGSGSGGTAAGGTAGGGAGGIGGGTAGGGTGGDTGAGGIGGIGGIGGLGPVGGDINSN